VGGLTGRLISPGPIRRPPPSSRPRCSPPRGRRHRVVARSVPRNFFWADDTIEIDGALLIAMKTK